MSENMLQQQHISEISAENNSHVFAGSAYNVNFAAATNPKEAAEKAASACRNALFLTDPYVDRESLISAKGIRVAGTCEWITHDETYGAWLNGDGDDSDKNESRLLWISGGPGKGKTMMSVFLTEELEKHTAHEEDAKLAFFFCSADDEKRNTPAAVLRGLVHQIITKRPQLIKYALPYFETPEKTQQTVWSLETLCIIFSKLVSDAELGTMFCILDGLDECEEGGLRALIPGLVGLFTGDKLSSTRGNFKLAIVSRELRGLQGCARIRLDPDNDKQVVSDIELFVPLESSSCRASKATTMTFGHLYKQLFSNAPKEPSYGEVWRALEDMPSGLQGIYGRMLLRIPSKQIAMSRAVLEWVTIAFRPLKLHELAGAVDIQSSSPHIALEQAVRDAVALCAPLLQVQEVMIQEGRWYVKTRAQVVSLVHQSARDYLLRKERDSDTVLESFRLVEETSHLELTKTCLDYIAQSDLQHKHIYRHDSQTLPLLQYAILYWTEHAMSCSKLFPKLLDTHGILLRKKSGLREYWWINYRQKARIRTNIFGTAPLLHIASTLGIAPWVEAVLAKKSRKPRYRRRVNKRNPEGRTALHEALLQGNESVSRLLLGRGADIAIKDIYGKTVLHDAAETGNEVVVPLLLDRGVDVTTQNKLGETALHVAAHNQNEVVVQLLLDRGVNMTTQNKAGETALHVAARRYGNEVVVQLLLDRGVDMTTQNKAGETALFVAARNANAPVVQLLLERGADVTKTSRGETVLHAAASMGSEETLKPLLKKGADVHTKDTKGETALHHSAERGGNPGAVQLLIEAGADIEAKSNEGWTALHHAVVGQRKGAKLLLAIQLLLEKGANIEAKSNEGWTALHRAVVGWGKGAQPLAIQLLLGKGADLETRSNGGWTALHHAGAVCEKGLIQLLLNMGANIKAKDDNGRTVLHIAVTNAIGYMEESTVQLLLTKGADIEAKDNISQTALHVAAKRQNRILVQLLVDSGADIEAEDVDGKTALQLAEALRVNGKSARLLERLKDRLRRGEATTGWTMLEPKTPQTHHNSA